jgi:molybdopterin/thiamine biosynthesis adenylyltransferase
MSNSNGAIESERYARQLRLEGFGPAAQRRLRQASVLVSRVGGVGGTVAAQLAQAGIGKLVLAHGGCIELEHLNRMQLANPEDVGQECSTVFSRKIKAINPDVEVVAVPSNITSNNVVSLVSQVDVIADGAPLFEERYLMNREAVVQRKPLVMAAMFGPDAYLTTIVPTATPCLSCLFPEKPPEWNHPSVFPAIGPSPRFVGSLAAMEVIKLLTGYGECLVSKLWFCDLKNNVFRTFAIERRADCTVCADADEKRELEVDAWAMRRPYQARA